MNIQLTNYIKYYKVLYYTNLLYYIAQLNVDSQILFELNEIRDNILMTSGTHKNL